MLRKLGIIQLSDSDQLSNTEAALYQVSARECVCLPLEGSNPDQKKLKGIFDKYVLTITSESTNQCRLGISYTEKKKSYFSGGAIDQDLRRLLGESFMSHISTFILLYSHVLMKQ